jgi:hypothetical protein
VDTLKADLDVIARRVTNMPPAERARARRREEAIFNPNCIRCGDSGFLSYQARNDQYVTYRVARCSCKRNVIHLPNEKLRAPFFDDLSMGVKYPEWTKEVPEDVEFTVEEDIAVERAEKEALAEDWMGDLTG